MVDVGWKPVTDREAVARGYVQMLPETLRLIIEGQVKKGDVFTIAQLAGIMGAKRTAELIPLCHPLPLNKVDVELEADEFNCQRQHHRHRHHVRQDRRGNGSPDRSFRSCPVHLRHVQGSGPGDADRLHSACPASAGARAATSPWNSSR